MDHAGHGHLPVRRVIYAKHILQTKPDAKIAILAQNDDFGRDYVAGFKRGLGDKAATMIVSEATYETSAPTISSQLATLKAPGPTSCSVSCSASSRRK